MNPASKRKIRLSIALAVATLLAVALIYTSFSASSEAVEPSGLIASADAGRSYQLTGKVVEGSISQKGTETSFRVRDRDGRTSVPVTYVGAVPDTFRDGREVIITVRKGDTGFVGEKDSLITKCPSKFTDEKTAQT